MEEAFISSLLKTYLFRKETNLGDLCPRFLFSIKIWVWKSKCRETIVMQRYLENLAQEQEDVVVEQASVDEVANSILSCPLDAFK